MPSLIWRLNPFSLIALGVLLTDQFLDLLIEFTISEGASYILIPGWLGIMRLPGPSSAAMSANRFIVVLTLIIVPLLWWYKRRIYPDTLYRVAVVVLLGGLLGNLADSLRIGYPVDYLLIGIQLNLADIALILGGGLLLYRILREEAKRYNKERSSGIR